MLVIDGSQGEGGGQILRTSLALSMCLSKPFKIINIRATRKKPGLQPQHLMAVRAASEVSHARVEGDELGSQQLFFKPQSISARKYKFSIGTAGSTTLVLQTVLPALILADAPSSLTLQGGTHNPMAPPYDFIERSYIPLINRMGPQITSTLERPGYFPKGGGIVQLDIQPTHSLQSLHLPERGVVESIQAEILLSHLPEHIAMRETQRLKMELNLADECFLIRKNETSLSPGNVITVTVNSKHITEVFSAIGERGLPAEVVADNVIKDVKHYLHAGVAVGVNLADQLLLPIALAGKGSFITSRPSLHTQTNIAVIKQFTGSEFNLDEIGQDVWKITL